MDDQLNTRKEGARDRASSLRRTIPHLFACAWFIGLAFAFLIPALSHGTSLGPYDVLHTVGLTRAPIPVVHNAVGSDEIFEFIPWQTLDWLQVHAGHLPLWNPYNLLGMPLAFNFQSAPFGLTVAVGYLFPLHLAHTVTVIARLVIAGTGAYVCCRMLRLGALASLMGGTIFELCGGFTIWLGAYEAGCLCFAGWVLSASLLILRGERRVIPLVLLSFALALCLLEGEPQIGLVLILFVACIVARVTIVHLRRGDRQLARRMWIDHLLSLLAGTALAAPVYLPGAQLLLGSERRTGPLLSGLPFSDLTHFVFSTYNGAPTNPGDVIGIDNLYVSMIYVGAIGLTLAIAALAHLRRRPEVAGIAIFVSTTLVVLFVPPVDDLLRAIPFLRVFRIDLATTLVDFGIALLAAFGVDALIGHVAPAPAAGLLHNSGLQRHIAPLRADIQAATWARRLFIIATAILGLVLVVLVCLFASGNEHLSTGQSSVRGESFIWPAISLAACGFAALVIRGRQLNEGRAPTPMGRQVRDRWRLIAILVLLGVQTAFLLLAGSDFVSSSQRFLPPNPAVRALVRLTGNQLVGFGSCAENRLPDAGVAVDTNAAYGIRELAVYDPIIPGRYYSSYQALSGTRSSGPLNFVFCPAVTNFQIARFYGVSYVLDPPGSPAPRAMRPVANLNGEYLYKIPGSGRVTVQQLSQRAGSRTMDHDVHVVGSTEPSPNMTNVTVDTMHRSRIVLHVTAVPGWHASIDGKPFRLERYDGILLSGIVPPGRHLISVRYWPTAFNIGLLLAALATIALTGSLLVAGLARVVRSASPSASSATK